MLEKDPLIELEIDEQSSYENVCSANQSSVPTLFPRPPNSKQKIFLQRRAVTRRESNHTNTRIRAPNDFFANIPSFLRIIFILYNMFNSCSKASSPIHSLTLSIEIFLYSFLYLSIHFAGCAHSWVIIPLFNDCLFVIIRNIVYYPLHRELCAHISDK